MPILSDKEIAGAVRAAGFPQAEWTRAVAVALAESAGKTDATNRNTNGSTDSGLFQINSIHAAILRTGNVMNPIDNAKMALRIWSDAGRKWTPWSAYNNGRFRMFLGRAALATGSPVTPNVGTSGLDVQSAGLLSPIVTFKGITDLIALLANPETWLRTSMFLLGSGLLIIAAFKLTGDNKLSPITKEVAKLAATKGLSARAKVVTV